MDTPLPYPPPPRGPRHSIYPESMGKARERKKFVILPPLYLLISVSLELPWDVGCADP